MDETSWNEVIERSLRPQPMGIEKRDVLRFVVLAVMFLYSLFRLLARSIEFEIEQGLVRGSLTDRQQVVSRYQRIGRVSLVLGGVVIALIAYFGPRRFMF
ncbi:MAG: hypothetical protein IT428_00935 [Planctomycetaceae bacterium]|nr:hypothetical protein [Planctomycetaceae bacterium]